MITLNYRQKAIVKELLSHDEPLTSEYLAQVIGVTSRTIRNDVKTLNSELKKIGIQIGANRGVGYNLDLKKDAESIQELFTEEERDQATPILPEDRVLYILKRVILADNFITLEQLANELFVSKSTVDNDLRQVEKLLEKFELTLLKKQNYGIKLMGSEMRIRFCLSECLTNMNMEQSPISLSFLEEIKEITEHHIEKLTFRLADLPLNNLVMHIAIAIERIKKGNKVELKTINIGDIEEEKEYKIAGEIVKSLEEKFKIKIPPGEISYITIHLLGAKQFQNGSVIEKDYIELIGKRNYQLVLDILSEINRVYHIDLCNDQDLIYGLSLHLRSAMNRMKYKMNLRNPILNDIKIKYPFPFELAIVASNIIQEQYLLSINEDEIGYIAIHLAAAIERVKNQKRRQVKRVAIVCASGLGTAKLLSASIESKFPGINIVGTYPAYSIKSIQKEDADLILSTIPIKEKGVVPILHINTLLTEKDVEKVKEYISIEYLNEDKTKSIAKLQHLFSEELFFSDIDKKEPTEIIKFMTSILNVKGFVDDSFQQSVLEREQISPTAIGNLVAIPHPIKPNALGSCIAIGVLKKPVKWGEQMVQLVLLLALNESDKDKYGQLFNQLWLVVQDKKLVAELCSKCDFSLFMNEIHSLKY